MKFKVGDRVIWKRTNERIKGKIISIDENTDNYPISVKFNDFMVFSFTSDGRFTLTSPIGLVKIELDKKINKILSL